MFNHSSRPILNYFHTRGISTDCYNDGVLLDVSGCFGTDLSEEALLLLDFFSHVKDFTKAPLDPGIKEEFFSVIRQMVQEHSSESSHDCEVNAESHDVLVHRKLQITQDT